MYCSQGQKSKLQEIAKGSEGSRQINLEFLRTFNNSPNSWNASPAVKGGTSRYSKTVI